MKLYYATRDTNIPGPGKSNELWKAFVPGIPLGGQVRILEESNIFEEFDPEYDHPVVDKTEIFVNLPTDLHMLFASGRFLNTLVDGYPKSSISVQCPEWFWPYLPSGCEGITTRKAKYYREYNFGRGFNPVKSATTPWQRLYFTESSVPPENTLAVQLRPDVKPEVDICIIGNGFDATATQSGLAEGLENACHNSGYTTIYLHSPKAPGDELPTIAGASSVIACGDSAFSYAAVAMGKPTLVFIKPQKVDRGMRIFTTGSNGKQYNQWPNVRAAEVRTTHIPDPMDVLRAHIKLCNLLEVPIGAEDE